MIAARRLMLLADQFQIFGFLTETLLNFFASRLQRNLLVEQCSMLRGERCDLRFASKKGAVLLVNPPAVNHALGGNEIAGQRGERDRRKFSLQSLRLGRDREPARRRPTNA